MTKWFENLRIKNKFLVAFTMIFLLVMVFFYIYFPHKQRESVFKEINRRILTVANTAALGVGIFLQDQSYTAWSEIIDHLSKEPDFLFICIYDENKNLIAAKPEKYNTAKPLLGNYYQPVKGQNEIEIKVPINYKKKYLGDIVLGMTLTNVKEEIHHINIVSAFMLTGIFAIVFLLFLSISDLINKPIKKLLDSVNKIICSGNYSERVDHSSKDEIGILANRFNEMIDMIEERNIELNQQFEELQKVTNLKDEFLAVTTHDLRSPLTAIIGFADLLLLSDDLSEVDKSRVSHIQSSSDFLANMVNDILEVNRLEFGKTEIRLSPMSLSQVIESSIKTLQYMALPKEIQLNFFDNTNGNNTILGNFDALLRVTNNLVSNAIKFTPHHGCVTVQLDLKTQTDNTQINNNIDRIQTDNPATQKFIHFAVKDNGIGIPEENISKLFDMYSLISKKGTDGEKGTGLGLSITQKMIDKHNGKILVESQLNVGTTFTVVLPFYPIYSSGHHSPGR